MSVCTLQLASSKNRVCTSLAALYVQTHLSKNLRIIVVLPCNKEKFTLEFVDTLQHTVKHTAF